MENERKQQNFISLLLNHVQCAMCIPKSRWQCLSTSELFCAIFVYFLFFLFYRIVLAFKFILPRIKVHFPRYLFYFENIFAQKKIKKREEIVSFVCSSCLTTTVFGTRTLFHRPCSYSYSYSVHCGEYYLLYGSIVEEEKFFLKSRTKCKPNCITLGIFFFSYFRKKKIKQNKVAQATEKFQNNVIWQEQS